MEQDYFEEIAAYVLENQKKFYRLVYASLRNEQDAMDVVQDAICKALEHSMDLRNIQALKTWFYRILMNESMRFLKKNKREVMLEETIEKGGFDWDAEEWTRTALRPKKSPLRTGRYRTKDGTISMRREGSSGFCRGREGGCGRKGFGEAGRFDRVSGLRGIGWRRNCGDERRFSGVGSGTGIFQGNDGFHRESESGRPVTQYGGVYADGL